MRQKAQLHHGIKELCLGNRDPQIAGQRHANCAARQRAVQRRDAQARKRAIAPDSRSQTGSVARPARAASRSAPALKTAPARQNQALASCAASADLGQFCQAFRVSASCLVRPVDGDGPDVTLLVTVRIISAPTFLRISIVHAATFLRRKNASASGVHIHKSALRGPIGGIWSAQSSWLTGLIPDALISRCICVATVPGDRPICADAVVPASSLCRPA